MILPPSPLGADPTRLLSVVPPTRRSPWSWQWSPETVVLLLAIAIGTSTAMAVVLFHWLIMGVHTLMLETLMGEIAPLGNWTLAIVPCIGGVIVGGMRWLWQDFGTGLSGLIATSQGTGTLKPLRGFAKAAAAAISLGTGASLGPEGPSVELGGNIGLLLGQRLKVSQERLRLLLGAGAAAGLAAGFNAPIAGVFFALEVVLGTNFATSAVSLVLLSAVVSALISQIGLGGQPAFTLPAYEVRSPLELPLYLGLGLFASGVAIAYTQTIQWFQQAFQGKISGLTHLGSLPPMARPVLGGVMVGLAALQFPQILGIGYETVEALLRDVQVSLPLLGMLLVAKLIMTGVSVGSGLVGGLFAPAMFLGAVLGAAYGQVLPWILPITPDSIAAPPAYAMVGMAAVLAASTRAPLTAVLLLFELTRDYRIILPLMAAVGLSVWLVERLQPKAQAPVAVQSTGLSTEPDREAQVMQRLLVSEAMNRDILTIAASLSVVQAAFLLIRHQAHCALVVDEAERLVGIVTLQDVNRAIAQLHSQEATSGEAPQLPPTLADVCTRDLLCIYEDESVAEAVARMAGRGLQQLPVIDRTQPGRVLGLLERDHITLACSLSMTQDALRHHLKPSPAAESVIEPLDLPSRRKTA